MDQGIMTRTDISTIDANALVADQRIRQTSWDFALALRASVPMHEDVECAE